MLEDSWELFSWQAYFNYLTWHQKSCIQDIYAFGCCLVFKVLSCAYVSWQTDAQYEGRSGENDYILVI